MFELEKTDEVRKLIAITKSDSGISGPSLADAHFRLGELLAESMPFDPQETTVMAILRGGIFFAEGIYHRLGCRFDLYDPKHAPFVRPDTRIVIWPTPSSIPAGPYAAYWLRTSILRAAWQTAGQPRSSAGICTRSASLTIFSWDQPRRRRQEPKALTQLCVSSISCRIGLPVSSSADAAEPAAL